MLIAASILAMEKENVQPYLIHAVGWPESSIVCRGGWRMAPLFVLQWREEQISMIFEALSWAQKLQETKIEPLRSPQRTPSLLLSCQMFCLGGFLHNASRTYLHSMMLVKTTSNLGRPSNRERGGHSCYCLSEALHSTPSLKKISMCSSETSLPTRQTSTRRCIDKVKDQSSEIHSQGMLVPVQTRTVDS